MVEEATVDAYDAYEQQATFHAIISERLTDEEGILQGGRHKCGLLRSSSRYDCSAIGCRHPWERKTVNGNPVMPAHSTSAHWHALRNKQPNFTDWPAFCNGGVIADNDPVEQEKAVKLTHLPYDAGAHGGRARAPGGGPADHRGGPGRDQPVNLKHDIMQFGTCATTELTVRPDAFDPHLDVDFAPEEEEPAAA
ncbi:hypothetical protein [Streptomyces sp. NRRL S-813]|uniref:hypothetical protein n=1 Tax=Streptomyces sp. NRRL S-813 TaxID=1463919 RepID=UPI00131A6D40|nr:hypothetical protein [Streptomyces sp. NRRL S-813]